MPKTVEEALVFDKENENDLWCKEIQKEMGPVKETFKILGENEKPQLAPSI